MPVHELKVEPVLFRAVSSDRENGFRTISDFGIPKRADTAKRKKQPGAQ
jgi:hypothetical protein